MTAGRGNGSKQHKTEDTLPRQEGKITEAKAAEAAETAAREESWRRKEKKEEDEEEGFLWL